MSKSRYTKISFVIVSILVTAFGAAAQESGDKVWIFFTDKGSPVQYKQAAEQLRLDMVVDSRSVQRRERAGAGGAMDITDMPVAENYLNSLRKMGIDPVVVSRWLNAASAHLTGEQLQEVRRLPFVSHIRTVRELYHPEPDPAARNPQQHIAKSAGDISDVYGLSFYQNNTIGTVPLHEAGVTGSRVLIGLIDDGFILDHEAFDSVKVIAKFDFIHGDTTAGYDPGQDPSPTQASHGTEVLSVIGGYRENELVGTAYGAEFALAKTEVIGSENPIEEDFWVAAVEWMDSVGVDIVSTSLGYSTFDNASDNYSLADMDGNTAVTTIAADIAAGKGILVLSSAGNEGDNPQWGIITAPADGDSVIAVGATYFDSTIVGFSSRGPTADGRIKPDIVAPGYGVLSAYAWSQSMYAFVSGTSFACPLAAGAAALVLSAHPELTWGETVTAIRETASRAGSPDNDYGWGMVNAFAAATYYGPAFSSNPLVEESLDGIRISTGAVSYYGLENSTVTLHYAVGGMNVFLQEVMTEEDGAVFSTNVAVQNLNMPVFFYFTAADSRGKSTVFPQIDKGSVFSAVGRQVELIDTGDPINPGTSPDKFVLNQNYPNPFNGITAVIVEAPEEAPGEIVIYNVLGSRIRTLYNGIIPPGKHIYTWDGTSDSGARVASGVYFCRFSAAGFSQTKKMLFLK